MIKKNKTDEIINQLPRSCRGMLFNPPLFYKRDITLLDTNNDYHNQWYQEKNTWNQEEIVSDSLFSAKTVIKLNGFILELDCKNGQIKEYKYVDGNEIDSAVIAHRHHDNQIKLYSNKAHFSKLFN